MHESVCVLIFGIDRGALAVSNSNPFWVDPSVAKWPRGKPIFPVSIQEQPVTITDTPVLEYRFLGWTSGGAHVAFLVAHREVGQYDVKFEPDGSVHLGLIGGSYIRLVRDHDDPNSAVSIFLATGATMTP